MRNLRLFVSLTSLVLIFTTLLYVSVAHEQSNHADSSLTTESSTKHKFFSKLFSFHGPSALFTPTATISLTDDNSTSFSARPAAFGPLLPDHGLSGPIWIGSGFAHDVSRRGGLDSTVEGELGCNDLPGWDDTEVRVHAANVRTRPSESSPLEADADFWQESAEIAGKIVLLSRGGCGFSDKVKWGQRRGATAVIVGDNVRGGALVRMYARGDTSNITIPSVFTSHGTAHLLSTLMPSSLSVDDSKGALEKRSTHDSEELAHILPKAQNGNQRQTGNPSRRVQWVKAILQSLSLRPGNGRPHSRTSKLSSTSTVWRNIDQIDRHSSKSVSKHVDSISDNDHLHISGLDDSKGQGHYKKEAHKVVELGLDGPIRDWRGYIIPPDDIPSTGGSSRHRRPHSGNQGPELHDGLWVTLTPSSMSPSPFFNTLFMLVVSPLVTLGIVYTMLLLRTRIQRRRWRAPKSVVDRLPIRIYRTVAERLSPTNEQPSGQSADQVPLLSNIGAPSDPADIPARSRSRTNSASGSAPQYGTIEPSSTSPAANTVHEKESALAEWRRKFGGTQVECVICLEEYVDGVSRVLQLPCGHDFHADCITPWLTTRRRTCPICKGDVVRSLQGGRNGSQSSQPVRREDEDEVQVQAAETENMDDDADLPVPMDPVNGHDYEPDVERAAAPSPGPSSLSSNLARSLQRRFTAWRRGSQEQPDRNR